MLPARVTVQLEAAISSLERVSNAVWQLEQDSHPDSQACEKHLRDRAASMREKMERVQDRLALFEKPKKAGQSSIDEAK